MGQIKPTSSRRAVVASVVLATTAVVGCSSQEEETVCDSAEAAKKIVREYAYRNNLVWPEPPDDAEIGWVKFDYQRPGVVVGLMLPTSTLKETVTLCFPATSLGETTEDCVGLEKRETPLGGSFEVYSDGSRYQNMTWEKSPEALIERIDGGTQLSGLIDNESGARDAGTANREGLPPGVWKTIDPCHWKPPQWPES